MQVLKATITKESAFTCYIYILKFVFILTKCSLFATCKFHFCTTHNRSKLGNLYIFGLNLIKLQLENERYSFVCNEIWVAHAVIVYTFGIQLFITNTDNKLFQYLISIIMLSISKF